MSIITTLYYVEVPYLCITRVANIMFFVIKCGITHFLFAMSVFDVRASSSPRLPLCQFHFFCDLNCWFTYVYMEKNCILNQSLNHSPILTDAQGNKALTLRNFRIYSADFLQLTNIFKHVQCRWNNFRTLSAAEISYRYVWLKQWNNFSKLFQNNFILHGTTV